MTETDQAFTVFNSDNQQTVAVAMPDDQQQQQGIQYITQDGVQISQLSQPEVRYLLFREVVQLYIITHFFGQI